MDFGVDSGWEWILNWNPFEPESLESYSVWYGS
jgi:hypothetical protein